MENQRKVIQQLKDRGLDSTKYPEKGIGIILDDLAYNKGVMKNESMIKLMFNRRHMKITVFMLYQYLMNIGQEMYEQVLVMFLFLRIIVGIIWKNYINIILVFLINLKILKKYLKHVQMIMGG